MTVLDINTWNRKQHFEHFMTLKDPFFGVTIPFNVTKAYQFSKDNKISFFTTYLHACMKAINGIENLKYRILDGKVVHYDVIHASPTLLRDDETFGFSFVDYSANFNEFSLNLNAEKERVKFTTDLFPPKNELNCVHCSALPWTDFSGHKEPVSGIEDSIPKLAFGKTKIVDNEMIMNVAINVNHALVDGYHVGQFSELFQKYLDK
ncbi:CatA-like O-acetyltransferase [Lacinutrix undariae]